MLELHSQSVADAVSDQHLVMSVANGDPFALACLYRRYSDSMIGLGYRLLGNRRDAEDLLHDVFVEIWKKAASYDEKRANVRAWLLLRVRSRAIDRLRKSRLAREHAMAEVLLDSDRNAPLFEPERSTERLWLRRQLACLSETQRSMVALSYFDGLTHQEIAVRCRIPVGTVKSRLAAATVRLRAVLKSRREKARQIRRCADRTAAE